METHRLKTEILWAALEAGKRVVADMGKIQVQIKHRFSGDFELVSTCGFSTTSFLLFSPLGAFLTCNRLKDCDVEEDDCERST